MKQLDNPVTIMVPMVVTGYRVFKKEKLVSVEGEVGDYGVQLCIPVVQAIAQRILKPKDLEGE